MSFKFDFDIVLIDKKLQGLKQLVPQIMPPTFQHFRQLTPKDTGNARARTTLSGNIINASYPYAKVLDNGRTFSNGRMRGSKQAPYGMSEPTKQFFMKKLAQALAQRIMGAR
jgi:hypothetical protein